MHKHEHGTAVSAQRHRRTSLHVVARTHGRRRPATSADGCGAVCGETTLRGCLPAASCKFPGLTCTPACQALPPARHFRSRAQLLRLLWAPNCIPRPLLPTCVLRLHVRAGYLLRKHVLPLIVAPCHWSLSIAHRYPCRQDKSGHSVAAACCCCYIMHRPGSPAQRTGWGRVVAGTGGAVWAER